jgi:P27 family predicted phage terminase small subunit
MGKRGPRPTPTNLRLLQGESRPSRINANEPVPANRAPEPPADDAAFTDEMRGVWKRVTEDLRIMGMLAGADEDLLYAYCVTTVKYRDAVRLVNQTGLMLRGRDGGVVKNPAVQFVRDFGAQLRVLGNEFGFSPAARVGLETKDKPSAGAGAERYLSG